MDGENEKRILGNGLEHVNQFLDSHSQDNVLVVLDTSAWLRLFRAAPNRVPGFLFNYFNCGYPLRITGHIQEEFDKNIDYVEKNAVDVQDATAKNLDRGECLQLYAMDKASPEKRGETYKKLLALYGGEKTNDLVKQMVQAMEAKPVICLTEEEAKQAQAEAAQLAQEGRHFPGSGDYHKSGNAYGDYLIYLELEKLAKEEKADIVFATSDYKEKRFWPSFEEEFEKRTGHELCFVDIPSFDQFTDRYGATADEVAGREQRNEIINKHLHEVEVQYAGEAAQAVEEYFALRRCFLPVPDWHKQPIDIKLLDHQETGFKVDFGSSDYGCAASYDCSFNVEADIEITYQIFPKLARESLTIKKETKKIKGVAMAVITRHYDRSEDINDLSKEHWIDISCIDFGF